MRIRIEKAHLSEAQYIGRHLRKIDQEEAWYATGLSPLPATLKSFKYSTKTWAAFDKYYKHPMALFGVQDATVPNVGIPWMVGTNALLNYKRELLSVSELWVNHLQSKFPILFNFCLPKNVRSIRWLRGLGFQVEEEARPYGPFNHPFVLFWRTSNV